MCIGEYSQMIELKLYQENAVQKLTELIREYLSTNREGKIAFQSPTGSGKTVIMAEVIKRIIEENNNKEEIAFVWISVHNLHNQSKKKLNDYYDNTQSIACKSFKEIEDNEIKNKEILFLNWESVVQDDNIIRRKNEKDFYLWKIIDNTKDANRKIILLIDENHVAANTQKANIIVDKMKPDVRIDISATPKNITTEWTPVHIPIEDVQEEEMIQKSIRLNPSFIDIPDMNTDELLLNLACEQRKELKRRYEKEGSDVNPLILIQLPNSDSVIDDTKDRIIKILSNRQNDPITLNNKKLGIHLANKKKNIDTISNNDDYVEVLIIKQAITVGWDCPRASILVLFREWRDLDFSIQTLGRIIRTPERKYYDDEDDELDHAYVYTNVSKPKIVEELSKGFIHPHESKRNNVLYDCLDLNSIYIKRNHERNRLSGKFTKFFLNCAKDPKFIQKIKKMKNPDIQRILLIDGEVTNINREQNIEGKEIRRTVNAQEIDQLFTEFIKNQTSGYAPKHSTVRIKRAIYHFFEKKLKIDNNTSMQLIVLDKNMKPQFEDIICKAKKQFKEKIADKAMNSSESILKWNIPEKIFYSQNHEPSNYQKNIMLPSYIKEDSDIEGKFMYFLDNHDGVKWWHKNGTGIKRDLSIQYSDQESQLHTFFIDFVVRMNDGRIGLFETKGDNTAKYVDTRFKAESLVEYIKYNKSKKIFGGIIIKHGNGWYCNKKEKYTFNNNIDNNWILLNKLLD